MPLSSHKIYNTKQTTVSCANIHMTVVYVMLSLVQTEKHTHLLNLSNSRANATDILT